MKCSNHIYVLVTCLIISTAAILAFSSCQKGTYTMEDYSKIAKIDAHVHDNSQTSAFVDIAKTDGFKILSINVDYPDFPPVEFQQKLAEAKLKENSANFAFASTFAMAGWDEPNWVQNTLAHLD